LRSRQKILPANIGILAGRIDAPGRKKTRRTDPSVFSNSL